jgi:quercetin dioxygenase-like cupin family protein
VSNTQRARRLATLVLSLAALIAVVAPGARAQTTSQDGVTRTILAQAAPANAPGQQLYLQEVTIAPKTRLGSHHHEGTQVARVRSGVLMFNVVSGTVSVTRADGSTEELTGPATIRLRPGDSIIERSDLVHYGANNRGKKPVVILLAALLAEDAPLATADAEPASEKRVMTGAPARPG